MYRRFNYMPPMSYRNAPPSESFPPTPSPSSVPVQKPPPPSSIKSTPPCKPPQKKKTPQKKKFNLKSFKKDTCSSLNDVEHFLNDFSCFLKYLKLYKLLK